MTARQPQVLDEQSCRALLHARSFGRLGFCDHDGVEILPVRYRVDDDVVIVRTGSGAKLDAARRGDRAALEIDAANAEGRSGWSVLVRGSLQEVTDPDELAAAEQAVQPLAGGDRSHVVRLMVDRITGRQIPVDREAQIREQTWTGRDATDLLG
jgi:nitroimidazol reductase NimA-like FMN-containing flavoprotein (pyridoxamine 5'-phosphate oxidase superfamily)